MATEACFFIDLLQLLGTVSFHTEAERKGQNWFVLRGPPSLWELPVPRVFAGSEQAQAFLAAFRISPSLLEQLEMLDLPDEWRASLGGALAEDDAIHSEFPCPEGQFLFARMDHARISTTKLVFAMVATTVARLYEAQTNMATNAEVMAAILEHRDAPAQSGSRRAYTPVAGAYLARASVVGGHKRSLFHDAGEEVPVPWLTAFDASPSRRLWTIDSGDLVRPAERRRLLEEAGLSSDLAEAMYASGIYALRTEEYIETHLEAFALDGSEPDLIAADDRFELEAAQRAAADDRFLLIDSHYQAILPLMEPRPVAVYGRTHEAPMFFHVVQPLPSKRPHMIVDSSDEGDREGEGLPSYLLRYRDGPILRARRVAIPRIPVADFSELERLVRRVRLGIRYLGKALLFRGQSRHHRLPRDPRVARMLYGADDVDEPSLPTSASRAGFDADGFAAAFQLQVQALLYREITASAFEQARAEWLEGTFDLCPFADGRIAQRYGAWRELYFDFGWDVAVMGLAQHYGIPTHGLDLTSSLHVALFFSLHRFDTERKIYAPRPPWHEEEESAWPVIYLVATKAPLQHQLETIEQLGLEAVRPQRQRAVLHYGGWGFHTNVCAEEVVAAAILRPGFKLPELPGFEFLFPQPKDDPFYRRLLDLKERALAKGHPEGYDRVVEYGDS